jgi:predicted Rossmann-fold nucleotide-binding protein
MKRMAEEGFLVASGGGPGAMEASSLGSMLKGKSAAEVQEALELIQTNNEQYEKEYMNVAAAELVTKRFGIPSPDTSPLNLGTYNEHHVC